jgi:peptidylprolyl isomerase
MKLKAKDCVQVDYVARIKSTNKIFDVTSAEEAKKENIYNKEFKYGSKTVCIGKGHLIPRLEISLVGKEEGEKFKLEIKAEEAFGKLNPKLIKTIPTSQLLKQRIQPHPGMQINASGMNGVIRTVTQSRTRVDFNHPLAGKDLVYEVSILKLIKDPEQIIKGLANTLLNLDEKQIVIEKKDKKLDVKIKADVPDPIKKQFTDEVNSVLTETELKVA